MKIFFSIKTYIFNHLKNIDNKLIKSILKNSKETHNFIKKRNYEILKI